MLNELLSLYESVKINNREPRHCVVKSLFFCEGWLLRIILGHFLKRPSNKYDFLTLPGDSLLFSEAQLKSPFPAMRGAKGDGNTNVDSLVGHFDLRSTSGVTVRTDARFLAIFEAKMGSKLDEGTTNAPGFDQLSRNVANLILLALNHPDPSSLSLFVYVLYPKTNRYITDDHFNRDRIKQVIARRFEDYCKTEKGRMRCQLFADRWEYIFDQISIGGVYWEELLDHTNDNALNEFYGECCRVDGRLN